MPRVRVAKSGFVSWRLAGVPLSCTVNGTFHGTKRQSGGTMNSVAGTNRIAIYARVSTAEQATDGVSLNEQVSRGEKWADAFQARVVATIRDEGVSGKTLNRPGVAKLWQLIDAGEIDAVWVADLSRIARSARDFANLVADFDARGIALISVRESMNTADTCGRLVAHIMAAVAQFEREQVADRTRAAMAQAKLEGRHIGRPPVGYTSVEGALQVADVERVALARRAAAMHSAGESYRAIAEVFNVEGVATGSGSGKWHAPAVGRLLRAARIAV